MIKAIIFDMDGLLIDSEPLWQKSEVAVLSKVGVPLTLQMTQQTTGLRTDEVINYWFKKYPWDTPSQRVVAEELDKTVIEQIKAIGKAKEGVNEAIAVCEALNLPIAIASSSSMLLIKTVLEKLGIKDKIRTIHSAHDEDYGKPHPAVYIKTAKELGVHPEHCLAFEDSANGVLSAKAAKMKCIAIPEKHMLEDKRFGIADTMLPSLLDFNSDVLKGFK